MPKTAAQLVPLKTQLASFLSLFRFSDASDLASGGALPVGYPGGYCDDRVYDNSGLYSMTRELAPAVNAITPPTGSPAVTTVALGSTTGGTVPGFGAGYSFSVSAHVSNGATLPSGEVYFTPTSNTSQLTLTWNPVTGAQGYIIWVRRPTDGAYAMLALINGVNSTSYTATGLNVVDTGSPAGTWTGDLASRAYNWTSGYNNPQSLLPPTGLTISETTTGGSWAPSSPAVWRVAALSPVGEALIGAQSASLPAQSIAAPSGLTATPATTGGTLADGTYHYFVTAFNATGETMASITVTATVSGGAGAGSVALAWTPVTGAVSYRVYGRSVHTSWHSTNKGVLATPTGASWTDTGAAAPGAAFSTWTYNRTATSTNTAVVSWAAQANAVGYRVYRGVSGAAPSTFLLSGTTTGTSHTDVSVVAGATPQAHTVEQALVHRGFARKVRWTDGASGFHKVGFSFTPVGGKRYRAFARPLVTAATFPLNETYGPAVVSPLVTVNTSSHQYVEFTLPGFNMVAGTDYLIGVEGEDATATITPGTLPYPLTDYPGCPTTEGNACYHDTAVTAANQAIHVQAPQGPAVFMFPMRLYRRLAMTPDITQAATIRGAAFGTNREVVLPNQTFTTPVRALTPSWSVVTPATYTKYAYNNPDRPGRPYTFEVSTDAGVTWQPLTNNVRLAFSTPASQLMFRIILAAPSILDEFTVPSPEHLDSNIATTANHKPEMALTGWRLELASNSNYPNYLESGYLRNNTYQYGGMDRNTSILHVGSPDIDYMFNSQVATPSQYNSEHGYRAENWSTMYVMRQGGAGSVTLYRVVANGWTQLATIAGQPTGWTCFRVILVGGHHMIFANGKLIIEYTDPTPLSTAYRHISHSGHHGYLDNVSVTGVPTSTFPLAGAVAPPEVDNFGVYLEV